MNRDIKQAGKYLGKKTIYSKKYDSSLLVRVERRLNREKIGYKYNKEEELPFKGFDIWNAYEISFLTTNGMPVCCIGKIMYSSSSKYIVESKSLKLYLNSFNSHKCERDRYLSLEIVQTMIKKDLQKLLETSIYVCFFFRQRNTYSLHPTYLKLENILGSENIKFKYYKENRKLLKVEKGYPLSINRYYSELLKSNCKVTNQPDFGTVFIVIKSLDRVDPFSLLKYIISFRNENHFHEEVCESIFYSLYHLLHPIDLVVGTQYTRRGGIDINPIRYISKELIDTNYLSIYESFQRTYRQ